MRITAGTFRSRKLKSLSGSNTRPTSDKMKEAIYSSIGPYFDGGVMLDLFGGSGGMGLEAISRGMDYAYIADHNYAAIQIIKENVSLLEVEKQVQVLKKDYKATLRSLASTSFSLIYIDPPYALHVVNEILLYIDEHQMLEKGGVIVVESEKNVDLKDTYHNFMKVKEKQYGISKVSVYNRGDFE